MTGECVRGLRRVLTCIAMLAAVALAACTSTQDVLEPSAITPPPGDVAGAADVDAAAMERAVSGTRTASVTPSPSAGSETVSTSPGRASLSSVSVQFAPIVGPSVEAATSLSERLTLQARERGIRVATRGGTGATHMLKGYFTPLIEGKQATVVYVWDVYDPTGNRVHRISGQEKASAGSGDGWAAVPSSAMQAIGNATIDQLAAWLSASG